MPDVAGAKCGAHIVRPAAANGGTFVLSFIIVIGFVAIAVNVACDNPGGDLLSTRIGNLVRASVFTSPILHHQLS